MWKTSVLRSYFFLSHTSDGLKIKWEVCIVIMMTNVINDLLPIKSFNLKFYSCSSDTQGNTIISLSYAMFISQNILEWFLHLFKI